MDASNAENEGSREGEARIKKRKEKTRKTRKTRIHHQEQRAAGRGREVAAAARKKKKGGENSFRQRPSTAIVTKPLAWAESHRTSHWYWTFGGRFRPSR